MNIPQENFEFKKGFFDNSFNIIFLTLFGIPIILFRNGVLDFTYVSIFFVFYALILYFSVAKIFKIKINGNSTEFVNVFGKKKIIPNNKISYSETYFNNQKRRTINSDIQTLKLEIQFPNHKVTLCKDEEENYDELTKYCKEHYSKNYNRFVNYLKYIIPTIIISLGIYFFTFTQNCYKRQNEDNLRSIKKYGYAKVYGNFKDYETIGRTQTDIWFHFYQYPKLDFVPTDFAKNKSKYYHLKKKGEKIAILVSPNAYWKKIKKSIPLRFYDKYFGYNEITAYKIK